MKKKTVKEVVLETIEYYENNPERRGVSTSGRCLYYAPDTGNMCAVGRCMKDPKQDYHCGIDGLEKEGEEVEDVSKEMKDEYSNIPLRVWNDLQLFHDKHGHWNNLGLSAIGQEYKEELLSTYCQN